MRKRGTLSLYILSVVLGIVFAALGVAIGFVDMERMWPEVGQTQTLEPAGSDTTATLEPDTTATLEPDTTATLEPNATATLEPNATATLSLSCVTGRTPLSGGESISGQLTINYPLSCQTLVAPHSRVFVGGNYSDLAEDHDIWVLVAPNDQLYFPQSSSACKGETVFARDGIWSGVVTMGSGDALPTVDIVAVIADPRASEVFRMWLIDGCKNNSYPGIPSSTMNQLSVKETDSITVFLLR